MCAELLRQQVTLWMSRRFIGGLYGRAIGRVLIHVHGGVPTDPFWMWMDPGAMALIGAASFFAGVSRLTMSLTVIMVRHSFSAHRKISYVAACDWNSFYHC